MSLHKAKQIAPFAQIVEADESAYYAAHEAAYTALSAVIDRIETIAIGEFLLEWQGNRDFEASGYSTQVGVLLVETQAATGLDVQIGVATHRFTAEQAARRISDDGVFVVRPGSDARFLAPFPITTLPNAPLNVITRLSNFGIRSLGQLAALPKPAFVRQFGSAFAYFHDLARGHDPRSVNPNAPPIRIARERRFDELVEERRVVIRAARTLAKAISTTLIERGYQAEALKLSITFASGSRSDTTRALKPPSADEERLVWYITKLVEAHALGEPVSRIAFIAYPVRKWHRGAQQLSLFEAEEEAKRIRLEAACQVLKHRFGEQIVRIAARVEPPTPTVAHVTTSSTGKPLTIREETNIRRIVAIEEFWREESGWWDTPMRRDYYRVILDDGSQRNLFLDCVTKAWFVDRRWRVLRAS